MACSGRRGAALVALIGAVGAGCGDDARETTRRNVDAYVRSEQAIMLRAQPGFERVNRVYREYARGRMPLRAAAGQVAGAERVIRSARDRVTVLEPPPEAERLHRLLLRFLDRNVEAAHETTRMAAYQPRARAALRPLPVANRRLRKGLRTADGGDEQIRTLRAFVRSIRTAERRLRRLDVPDLLVPAHGDQLRRLGETRALSIKLGGALEDQDSERLARLLQRFRSVEAEAPDQLVLDRAASRYRRRMILLDQASADVRREQARLARKLR